MRPPEPEPLLLVIRRDCVDRYRFLEDRFAGEPVRLIWDRRGDQRRRQHLGVAFDRRFGDRRGPAPESWTSLDFVIARSGPVHPPRPAP